MTKVLIQNSDGSLGEIDLPVDLDGSLIIDCGNATTDPNPTVIDCGGA